MPFHADRYAACELIVSRYLNHSAQQVSNGHKKFIFYIEEVIHGATHRVCIAEYIAVVDSFV